MTKFLILKMDLKRLNGQSISNTQLVVILLLYFFLYYTAQVNPKKSNP